MRRPGPDCASFTGGAWPQNVRHRREASGRSEIAFRVACARIEIRVVARAHKRPHSELFECPMFVSSSFLKLATVLVCLCIGRISPCQEIQWARDLDTAQKSAREQQKPVLLHFGASWCRPCQEVESFVFRSPTVIREMNATVIPVKVDVDQNPDLAKHYQVGSIPCDVVITPQGKLMKKRSSPRDADAYGLMLKEVVTVSSNLQKDGEFNLERLQEMQARWDQSRPPADDQLKLDAFDQQRPLGLQNPAEKLETPQQQLKVTRAAEATANTNLAGGGAFNTRAPAPASSGVAGDPPTQANEPIGQASVLPSSSGAAPFEGLAQTAGVDQRRIVNPFVDAAPENPSRMSSQSNPSDREARLLESNERPEPSRTLRAAPEIAQTSGASNDPSLCLEGDCPVTLLTANKWVRGNSQFGAVHRGRIYLFASAECQAEFLKTPDRFSPLLAGYDPVIFHEQGFLVEGTKAQGVFMSRDGRQHVILFQDAETRNRFRSNPTLYLSTIQAATESIDAVK